MSTFIQWTDDSSNPLMAKRIDDGKLGWYCVPGPLEHGKMDPTCIHCYASAQNKRCGANPGRHGTGSPFKLSHSELAEPWLNEKELRKIAGKRKAKRIFVCDMTDVCCSVYECPNGHATEDEEHAADGWATAPCRRCDKIGYLKWWPSAMIHRCFDAWSVAAERGMTIQMLTKRPLRLAYELEEWSWLGDVIARRDLPLGWHIGTSLGNRKGIHRIDQLRAIPACLRFLSLEPLIEDLGQIDLAGIGWVIVGGESGGGARVCDVRWIDSIVEQCRSAGVAVFVKQLGACVREFGELRAGKLSGVPLRDKKGGDPAEWPGGLGRFPRELPT